MSRFDDYYEEFDRDFMRGLQDRLDRQWEAVNREAVMAKLDGDMQEAFASLPDDEGID